MKMSDLEWEPVNGQYDYAALPGGGVVWRNLPYDYGGRWAYFAPHNGATIRFYDSPLPIAVHIKDLTPRGKDELHERP
jgi:hypothetical protein